MKTVGNDLVRRQLHHNRKWYIGLGVLLTIFGLVLLASLPFATLSAVFIFGVLMMVGAYYTCLQPSKFLRVGFGGFGRCLAYCIWLQGIMRLVPLSKPQLF